MSARFGSVLGVLRIILIYSNLYLFVVLLIIYISYDAKIWEHSMKPSYLPSLILFSHNILTIFLFGGKIDSECTYNVAHCPH